MARIKRRNVIKIEDMRPHSRLTPKNQAQDEYVKHLYDQNKKIIFAVGPAGTGKTFLAVLRAIEEFKSGQVKKIVITRPAVSVDEKHGYLPGDINDKMQPWIMPVLDTLNEEWGARSVRKMMEDGTIEVCPLAFMRGRNFRDCFVLADEMQNSTPSQSLMCMTRLAENSRLVVTGDLDQHDRGFDINGLSDFLERIQNHHLKNIAVVRFGREHVERSEIVQEVLDIYQNLVQRG